MYNVGTKITIEAREVHTFCDGAAAIIWEVKVFEFKELAELGFRITEGKFDFNHDPRDYGTEVKNLFDAREIIKSHDESRRKAMESEVQNNENS